MAYGTQTQDIVCLDCAARIAQYPDSMDLDFNETIIEGTTLRRYRCDECSIGINYNTRAAAWCQWYATNQKRAWEHEYLTDMKTIKEIIR